MRFWVGVTDNGWFDFLAARGPDEVSFWQPSATPPFKNAPTGMPFLFKPEKPHDHIAGGGFFVTYGTLPISVAWEVFGERTAQALSRSSSTECSG
jgi:putative restriction endonuclease